MSLFRAVFIGVIIATTLLIVAILINSIRPAVEVLQPRAALARAVGKCAECHRQETSAVVHEFEMSRHAEQGVTCLDCHQPVEGQQPLDHRGFTIATNLTSANCAACHPTEYNQFLRSRHAAPAWGAVTGLADFTPQQIAFSEQHHPGAVQRPANALVEREGPAAITRGCMECHDVGRPNPDGSIGTCTNCHARHVSSIELARSPQTCGQCHMGPDHSQIEIYHESKHGVLFAAQRAHFNMAADPKELSTGDMPVPTCATCHMSGLEGMNVTHDTTERLSYFLFAATSDKRPGYAQGQLRMKETCLKCHTEPTITQYYSEAEAVVKSTNDLVLEAQQVIKGLTDEGLLTSEPFDEPIEYAYFDLWHYYGRTAKHGAFMGGADFVQWHGFYELVHKISEIKDTARELRDKRRAENAAGGQSTAGGA